MKNKASTKGSDREIGDLKAFLTLWHQPSPDGDMFFGACCSIK